MVKVAWWEAARWFGALRLTVPTSRRLFRGFQHTRLSHVSTRLWGQARLEGWQEGKSTGSRRPDRICRKNFLDRSKALAVDRNQLCSKTYLPPDAAKQGENLRLRGLSTVSLPLRSGLDISSNGGASSRLVGRDGVCVGP